jgi:6-pyruvoyltetrahydropterin/6-carboxytetrahydropterin synthase
VPFHISKEFTFSAAHHLLGLPVDHPCSNEHGHNYKVRIVLSGPLNKVGFVRDYRELDKLKEWIDDVFDHKSLNAKPARHYVGNPTAENIARAIFNYACTYYPETVAVGVSETDKTWAWYSEEEPDNEVLRSIPEDDPSSEA